MTMTTATKTEYEIKDYTTGKAIGVISLDDDQFAEYEGMSQQPQGILSASDLLDAFPFATMCEPFESDLTVYLD